MGLYSHTRSDGVRETVVDFPYYLSTRKAKYFQPRNREEALVAANNFAAYCLGRGHKSATVKDYPDKQSIHVVYLG